jgi:competence protein ComEC
VPSVALLPAVAILAGAAIGITEPSAFRLLWLLPLPWILSCAGFAFHMRRTVVLASSAGFLLAGTILGGHATERALHPPLRTALDEVFGGFDLADPGPPGLHDPVFVRARLSEDASVRDEGVLLRVEVEALAIAGRRLPTGGGVLLTVSGTAAPVRSGAWRAGRRIEAPVTFRRPARYLNDGVPDFERNLALDGVALTGTVKSALLVDVIRRGSEVEEAAASIRSRVRRDIGRWVGTHGEVSAGIVTAILIGDRTGLPEPVRTRLQAAGTYHVIAISGGNIAILAALMAALLVVGGITGTRAAVLMMAGLVAYACVVTAAPSVWRATLTVVVYLGARLLDHRSPPWNAMAVSAAMLVCAAPLDVRDAGFALTFGATAAILEGARRARGILPARPFVAWPIATGAASVAAEIALLPIAAFTFSRVTVAGVVLNLVAVPLMAVAQIAGLAAVATSGVDPLASAAGWIAHLSARGLVESARLVEIAPWLTARVPPPAVPVVAGYYVALLCTLWGTTRLRQLGFIALLACGLAIVSGRAPGSAMPVADGRLRLTVFDVGQGDAMLLQLPRGSALMVDAGGVAFGASTFDIGSRVLAPALWAKGVRSLDVLALTHGDPDHVGGARSIVRDFQPRALWEGVPVARHWALQEMLAEARLAGARVEPRRTGDRFDIEGAQVRVLHPPPPDWERLRVRNDDSLVLEVRYGETALLLTGDISAEVERSLIPRLSPSRTRILKVAHHGSRTSTSAELLAAWRPQIAVISCGRGNRFGHPSPEVLRRLDAAKVRVYRTDRDGQITLDTDGRGILVRTYLGGTQ